MWSDFECFLKAELVGLIDGLGVGTKKSQGLKFFDQNCWKVEVAID